MIRVLELFAGIGACSKALTNLGIEHEIVDAVEIDRFAVASFNAVHGTSFEPQDICEWDKDIEVDLIMHGSPCQDFSVAGRQAGGDRDSGTRSSLMYETLRIVEKLRPKYVIWENVKNLLSKKHRHNFDAYLEQMEKLGYKNYYQVLNAKDYGVPQNRERVFTVSIKETILKVTFLPSGKTIDHPESFEFPARRPLTKHLKDVLEAKVDEKYYLSEEQVRGLAFSNPEVAYCLDANYHKGTNVEQYLSKHRRQLVNTIEPFTVASRGRGENNAQHLEPRKDGLTNTITSVQKDNLVAKGCRIRKLTPKECWRLMAFDDEDFDKAAKVNSSTQLYKQAGNSIVVSVIQAILAELLDSGKMCK